MFSCAYNANENFKLFAGVFIAHKGNNGQMMFITVTS